MKNLLTWPVLWWLRFWARLVLKKVNPTIIGITGSAGKTSLMMAIEPVAKLKFKRVRVSHKANSESGIPADILGLHFTDYSFLDWLNVCALAPIKFITSYLLLPASYFDCYVVEMGIDEPAPPKNMGYLLTILKPQIGVVLNALPVHTEQFEDQLGLTDRAALTRAIAQEKGKLVTDNPALTCAVLNADQVEITALQEACLGSHLTEVTRSAKWLLFGKNVSADVRLVETKPSIKGTVIRLQYNEERYDLELKDLALPEFYGVTLAASFTVGIALGLDPKKISQVSASKFALPPSRGQIYPGVKNTTIIDSSYNASREPMIGSLNLLKQIAGKRKKVAVLGDMRELGIQARSEHLAVAQTLLTASDQSVLVGPLMKKYVLPVLQKEKKRADWFPTAGRAVEFLKESLRGGEIIMVKGSQNTIFLEIVVERLLSDDKDAKKLCRRGKFWDQQRQPYQ